MAFIRDYSEQGDPPTFRTLRAGRLVRTRKLAPTRAQLIRHARKVAMLRAHGLQVGDPFKFKMPKFVRKLTLKKVASGFGKLAKAALPIAAPFIPGVGPFLAPLLGGALAGGGSPDAPAPELVQQPEFSGTVGEQTRGYTIPGVEVRASRYRDYDDDEYEDEYDDDDEYVDESYDSYDADDSYLEEE